MTPARSPSQVAWIWPIMPVLVNIWLLRTRSTWWRWQGLQPSSHRPGYDGLAISKMPLWATSLVAAFGSPPWQETQPT